MNETALMQYVEQTEDFIRRNRNDLEPHILRSLTELYDDLSEELNLQHLREDSFN